VPREFEIRKEVDLNGTPEEVWEAITTPGGLAAWLFGDYEVVPGEGGSFRLTVGDFVEETTITGWDPPRRMTVRGATDEHGSFHAFEYVIEAKEGGTAHFRFVHSGFADDTWADEYVEQTRHGWDMYFQALNEYLTHFKGRPATYILAAGTPIDGPDRTYAAMRTGLGLSQDPELGETVRLTPTGIAPIDGVADIVQPFFLGVRTADAMIRFFGFNASVAIHNFNPAVDRPATVAAWQTWLGTLTGQPT
jgi:uncharacterized protein YndB with AHSA1/START domain